jgi:hypothetical protein
METANLPGIAIQNEEPILVSVFRAAIFLALHTVNERLVYLYRAACEGLKVSAY